MLSLASPLLDSCQPIHSQNRPRLFGQLVVGVTSTLRPEPAPGRSRRQAVLGPAAALVQVLRVQGPVQAPRVQGPGPVLPVQAQGLGLRVQGREPVLPARVPEPARWGQVPDPEPVPVVGPIRPGSWPRPCPPGRCRCPATPRTSAG